MTTVYPLDMVHALRYAGPIPAHRLSQRRVSAPAILDNNLPTLAESQSGRLFSVDVLARIDGGLPESYGGNAIHFTLTILSPP
jgi:hypothetical protein